MLYYQWIVKESLMFRSGGYDGKCGGLMVKDG